MWPAIEVQSDRFVGKVLKIEQPACKSEVSSSNFEHPNYKRRQNNVTNSSGPWEILLGTSKKILKSQIGFADSANVLWLRLRCGPQSTVTACLALTMTGDISDECRRFDRFDNKQMLRPRAPKLTASNGALTH